ncbi:tetratricopeptide repeat protein [Mesonia aquimarina]|uniref:tetratricopeptide repeat protein n=1 Tax=Mesonia aquimarina TaxID=1504967 RepID=UPI0013CEA58E|nr:tetratricopeptide repeat protein [Mesonia aquimarina]
MKVIFRFSLIFLLTMPFVSVSQELISKKECEKLIDEGVTAMENRDYAIALEKLTKVELIADKKKWDDELSRARMILGVIYNDLSNYGESLQYYRKAYEIAIKNPEFNKRSANILNNIGELYFEEENYSRALEYYKKAHEFSKSFDAPYYNTPLYATNIAVVYNKLGDLNESDVYLEQALAAIDKIKSVEIELPSRIEYARKVAKGENLLLQEKFETAKDTLLVLYNTIRTERENEFNVHALFYLSRIYENQGNINEAIKMAKKGLLYSNEIKDLYWKLQLYNQVSELYYSSQQFELARNYKDSIIMGKNALTQRVKMGLFEANKVKLGIQEYKNQLQFTKQKQRSERRIYILISVFAIVLFLFAYRGLRNRVIKQKQKQQLIENKQRITQLEVEDLKNKIAQKNRRLASKALYFSGRNEVIENTIKSLLKIPVVAQDKEVLNYIENLRKHLITEEEWEEFIMHFEKVNPNFITQLKERHPSLTSKDIRFLCYIYMNLDIQEISNLFNITYNAGRKRKKRILKKMKLEESELALYEYLFKLS